MRIQSKLFSILSLLCVLVVIILVYFAERSVQQGMLEYVNAKESEAVEPFIEAIAERYAGDGGWHRLQNNHYEFRQLLESSLAGTTLAPPNAELRRNRPPPPRGEGGFRAPPPRGPGPGGERPRGPGSRSGGDGPRGPQGDKPRGPMSMPPERTPMAEPPIAFAVLDIAQQLVVGRVPQQGYERYLPIDLDGQQIGYLVVTRKNAIDEGYELDFVDSQHQSFLMIAIVVLLLAMLVAIGLSRHFVRPIRALAKAMNQLTQGNYDIELEVKRKDEVGALARDCHELARTLEKNQLARQRWIADVSHELRTPVAIMGGEIEAILDGIRPLNQEQIKSLGEEVSQLQRLIEDLHELTRSDLGTQHYRKDVIDIRESLAHTAEKYRPAFAKQDMQVTLTLPDKDIDVFADEGRLLQLFSNLLTNILKYAKGATKAHISAAVYRDTVNVMIEDDGEGVSEESLPLLFDYLFRAEQDRRSDIAGSGLGLAICKRIVEAHDGQVEAVKSTMGGLGISIELPLSH